MSSATSSLWKTFRDHRNHRSENRDQLITISPESVIIFPRNPDHDHPGIAITIARNRRSPSPGIPTRDAMSFLPPGTIDTSASRVQSAPFSLPGHTSNCIIKGKLDTLVRFNDDSFGIVDFKTSGPRSEHNTLYSRQLHGYALALENAAPGNLLLSPVTRLGLIVFEPSAFLASRDKAASLSGDVNWIEIPRNDSKFLSFLDEVLSVLELPNPPRSSPTCQWCQYRDTSRITKF